MLKVYRKPQKDEFLLVGVDTAAGGADYSASQFISKSRNDVPMVYHSHKIANEMTNELFPILEKIYDITGNQPVVAYERNNGGQFEMERLASYNRFNKYTCFQMPTYGITTPETSIKYGWDTNTATRPKMLADLKNAIDKMLIKIYDRKTIEELFSFIIVQTSSSWKAQAEVNAHDDLVMSLAIAWQLYQYCEPPQKEEPIKPKILHEQRYNNNFIDPILGDDF